MRLSVAVVFLASMAVHGKDWKHYKKCNCMVWEESKGWYHNANLTKWVCRKDWQYKASYEEGTQECRATAGEWFPGSVWQDNCYAASTTGYGYFDAWNNADADLGLTITGGAVSGDCDR
ncbi:hypothetical protein E4U53_007668 [Claviceps sorghi]|nr:hypothetical protein E4U53_007668 [Claviceps sorghi]